MKRMFRVVVAGLAVILPPAAAAQDNDVSRADMLKDLEAKAVQLVIGKTPVEIRRALEAGPYADVQITELEYGTAIPKTQWENAVEIRAGDLNVMFSAPKQSFFAPSSPRVSIIVGMQDGVAVSIERVTSYPK